MFKLCIPPQLYGVCCLSKSSVKLETLANTWNFESAELIVAFAKRKLTFQVFAVTAKVMILECHFTAFPTSEYIQSEEIFGCKCLEWVRKILGSTLAFVQGIILMGI